MNPLYKMRINRMGVESTPGEFRPQPLKKRLFRPFFEKVDFGHLFLSIFKKFQKSCRKKSRKNDL